LSQPPIQALTWIEETFAAAPPAWKMARDPLGCVEAERPGILAEIDGDIEQTEGLVRRDGAARHFTERLAGQFVQAGAVGEALLLGLGLPAQHPASLTVQRVPQRAVLADHGGDGPVARDGIAPTGRPARDGDDGDTGGIQRFQRRIGSGGQAAIQGQGIVDISQHPAQPGKLCLARGAEG
jgi:hypothetical protein